MHTVNERGWSKPYTRATVALATVRHCTECTATNDHSLSGSCVHVVCSVSTAGTVCSRDVGTPANDHSLLAIGSCLHVHS